MKTTNLDNLIEEIKDHEWQDERERSAVDLSDVKRWARLVAEAVKEDLEALTDSHKEGD